jgi:outer membrane receptor protein involved in Fe transport
VLLGASEEDARRTSLRYSASLRLHASTAVVSTITAGLELSRLQRERSGSADVIDGVPSASASRRNAVLYVDTVSNTGAFAQVKLDIRERLFLVAGLRGEQNSSFGAGHGTALASMAGASYVRQLGELTVKVRAAHGKGIRPPPPSARKALATGEFRQLANPGLAPETQSGVEGGIELYFVDRLSLSVTAFDQRAEGLIQHVLPDPRVAPRAVQLQNVGEISNRGLELTARGSAGWLAAEATLATVASRVEVLSRFYTGDLRVGDRVPEVPSWSLAAALSASRRGLTAIAGVSCLGSWTGYDWLRYYAASAGGTAPGSLRDYWIRYTPTVRPHLVLTADLTPRLSVFARVDNLLNAQEDTRDNLLIAAGRTTGFGLRWATP